MKKALFILSAAAMLFAGCAKEALTENDGAVGGGLTDVTFTAQMSSGESTKAAVDGDGNAANVNRCIMEVYYGDDLFTRMYAPVNSQKKASFTTQLVSNRTYKVAFWADKVDNAATEAGLSADKYYTTNADQPNGGLKAVSLKGAYIGNDDARDAFFHSEDYTVAQAGSSFDVTLKRPFAQVNVITTDWDKVTTVDALKPETVDVTIANPMTVFNAVTGEVSADPAVASLHYNAAVYTAPAPTAQALPNEKTLSMDYLFAATEKAVVDMSWKAQKSGNDDVSHAFSNIPYQRNYRTNIKGALLTTTGQWNVTVDPIWEGEYIQLIEVDDIKSANVAIVANTNAKILDVKFKAEPNDSGVPTGQESSPSRAILTSPIAQDATLSVEVQTNTATLYVGDYANEYNVNVMASSTNQATVNINVPQNTKIGKLVVNAPSKSVYLNGKAIANVGEFDEVDAITSQNTLIIEPNQLVKKLTIRQGGLEIHGTVNTLEIEENAHDSNPVKVRACENLSQSVFDVIYTAGDHDYIDRPAYIQKAKGTSPETWDIVPSVCKIGDVGYASVETAFAAVQDGQTIIMLQNEVLAKGLTVETGEKQFTLDLNGKTISIAETGFDFSANGTNVALRSGVPQRFAFVVNGNGTMNIVDDSSDAKGKIETKNFSYGTVKTILVDGNAIVNLNGGNICADYAPFYVVGYTGTTPIVDPASVPKPSLNVNGGKISGNNYGVAIKGNTARLMVTAGVIESVDGDAISTNGTQDWYDGGNSSITISGGTVRSANGATMYLPAESPTTITGGLLEGADGIVVKGGTLSISGDAVVKANGPYGEAGAAESGHSDTGSCIYVEDTYQGHKPIVNISGGKFSSVNNQSVEYFTNKEAQAADKGKITLTGGLYAQEPDAVYCAESYIVVESGDATYPWKVQIDPQQAEVSIAKTGETTVYSMLAQFRDDVNSGNSYEGYTVTLLKDVTYSPTTYWTPIGYMNGTPFSGTFNGNGHKVEGLNIDTEKLGTSPDYWPGGFFGYTCEASISNLTLYGQTDCSGFVGYAEYTNITDCVSYMNSDLCYNISGGFIAHANAYVTLTNCKNYGNFICKTSANYCEVGGLVGRFYGGDHCSVTNCENHGNITWKGENGGGNQRSLGGIVAGFYNSSAISNPQKCVISGCKNYGVIYNKNATSGTTTTTLGGIGGIVGKPFLQANGIGVTIINCINEGSVISSGRAGGIIGTLNEAWQSIGKFTTVSDCTNSGTIYGTDGSRGQIYGVMYTNSQDPGKDTVLSNNEENGTLKAYDDYSE